ncbi:hypothetical protein MTO96_030650 [Rhipicephalus appendiculatus]
MESVWLPGFFEWTRPVPREQWDPRDPVLLDAAKPYEQVEQVIGYDFHDKGFLVMCFTHRSLPASLRIVPASMDATEVLGDAWLKYFLANKLYGCIQPLTPRSLPRRDIPRRHKLLVRTGRRPPRVGPAAAHRDYPGRDRTKVPPKVLADAFEALFGAVFLDSNMDMAATWNAIYRVLQPHIDHEVAAVAAKSALYLF